MSESERKIWGIHTQDQELFLKHNVIAIGWKEIGDLLSLQPTRDAIKTRYLQVFPSEKKGSVATSAGMLYRFCYEAQIGDLIIYPSKIDRMINIGEITGSYEYVPDAHEYVNQRGVKWLKHLPRTAFSQGALYEIGSAMSFFSVKNYADEFISALDKDFMKKPSITEEDETVKATAEEILESTRDFILKELSRNFKGYALEEFVADLLRAMGYRTKISPQGGDSGIDITAYKDELPPRILVQVKSQDGDTKNARKYLENTPIIRGINGTELVDLILKYYDDLDDKYKQVIPLKMTYIPVPKN